MGAACLGIDFSGGAAPWRPRCARPSVWIARVVDGGDGPRLDDLRPVQALPGGGEPFDRLVALLAAGGYAAAAIDAPFSIPRAHLPPGGRAELLRRVGAEPPAPDRPFPRGAALVDLAEEAGPKARPKPLRDTERAWAAQGVNARSTLWNGPRGGAPFAAAALALLARAGRPCWPWTREGPGLLAEAFPAAQLRLWGLPHAGYGGPDGADTREAILRALDDRVAIRPADRAAMAGSADALDAVLAAFGALAVAGGKVAAEPPAEAGDEGWIAVAP